MADVEFSGERFAVSNDGVPLMALMRFAHVASGGTDSNDLAGLAAMYDLLEHSVSHEQRDKDKDGKPTGPTEWERFQQHAMKVRAKGDDLMKVVKDVIQSAAARPTGRPSDSSGGPIVVGQSSGGDSGSEAPYLRVIRREEESGRPDRALMVLMAQEARSA